MDIAVGTGIKSRRTIAFSRAPGKRLRDQNDPNLTTSSKIGRIWRVGLQGGVGCGRTIAAHTARALRHHHSPPDSPAPNDRGGRAGTGVPARSRTAEPTRGQPTNPRRLPARRPPRHALPHMSTHALSSARRMAYLICRCSSRRHPTPASAGPWPTKTLQAQISLAMSIGCLQCWLRCGQVSNPARKPMLSMAVSKPLRVPR
jgi:hypothetical protein